MIKYTQTKLAVRNKDGLIIQRGNCYSTAIGCLLEIDPVNVPNIETLWDVDVSFAYDVIDKWLESKGLYLDRASFQFSIFHEDSEKIVKESYIDDYLRGLSEDFKISGKVYLRDQYYIVSGKSPRGVNHVCIYQNGVMVHDPHPSRDGLLTEEDFETIKSK